MTELVAGLVLGLSGSAHCALMCGPLVLALHRGAAPPGTLAAHHLGRLAVYAVAGLAAGTAGAIAEGTGVGRLLAVATGVLLVVTACRTARAGTGAGLGAAMGRGLARLTALTARVGRGWPYARGFALGALNGLLPCGMVYTAVAASLALGGTSRAALFMLGFGLGTVPMLTAALAAIPRLSSRLSARRSLVARLVVVALGLLLIAQGVGVRHTGHEHSAHDALPLQ
jgi:uncharacterized protein